MIRAGTIGRVPTWTPDPARFPRFALLDGPSPLAPLPRLSAALGGRTELWIKREDLLPLAFGGNKLRNLEYLVGAALAEGADTPRHVRPALVEPRPADRRGRRAGGSRGPPRPVRTADRPAQPRRRARRAARRDGPPGRHGRPSRARGAPRARRGRAARGRPAPWRWSRSAVGASPARSARSCAGLELADQVARRAGSCRTTWSSRRRRAAPRPGCWSGCARPACRRSSTASRSPRAEELRPAVERARRRARRGGRVWRPSDPADDRSSTPTSSATATADPTEAADEADPPPRPVRGHPGRPDLHREGAGRAHRARPVGRARRPSGRVLARRRHARPVRTAAEPRRLTRSATRPDRHASRSLIRPPNWRTAPA